MGKAFLPKIFIPVATKTVWDRYRGQALGLMRDKKSGMDTRSSSAWRVCSETTISETKWECTPESEAQAGPEGVCRGKERALSRKGIWIFTKREEVVKEQVGFLLVWACSPLISPRGTIACIWLSLELVVMVRGGLILTKVMSVSRVVGWNLGQLLLHVGTRWFWLVCHPNPHSPPPARTGSTDGMGRM